MIKVRYLMSLPYPEFRGDCVLKMNNRRIIQADSFSNQISPLVAHDESDKPGLNLAEFENSLDSVLYRGLDYAGH